MVLLRQLKVQLILPFVWVMALLACTMQPASAAVWRSQVQPPALSGISSVAALGSSAASDSSMALGSSANTWSEGGTFVASVAARIEHTAVWTGTEMIIWGGRDPNSYLNTGGRYNPTSGVWTPISMINAPAARSHHTAVWTGTEMIVWGGYADDLSSATPTYFNNGGRYNPTTDTWTPLSLTGAPLARADHTAVWTGSSPATGEMIVWGGNDRNDIFNTGGRYNPRTDTWTATSTTNAPSARIYHTAVWTGTGAKMVVWGGYDYTDALATGGLYDPTANTWTATAVSGAPEARYEHTAVWAGNTMVVWGGFGASILNTGGRYNPANNTWSSMTTTSAPAARAYHTAVWTGTYMLVWGGYDFSSYLNTGGRYNPSADTWSALSTTGAPAARAYHTAVWTGTEMIIWTGRESAAYFNTGGRYNPSSNTWTAMVLDDAPSARYEHTAVWTGAEMIVWGGDASNGIFNTGGRYNPTTNTWKPISTTNAPSARFDHTAVWTGGSAANAEMIIWGGYGDGVYYNTGARYNPVTDTWTPMSTTNAPTARSNHTAVWTGSEMIVWGGGDDTGVLDTGARYNPGTNTWTPMSLSNAPSARDYHTAVWTGTEMIVWGGEDGAYLNTGGRYTPASDTWSAISTVNAPSARYAHTALWTGDAAQGEMIIWGGCDDSGAFNTGGRYNPGSNTWVSITTTNAPSGRAFHSAVWARGITGHSVMIVWGGGDDAVYFNTGGIYDPTIDTWVAANSSGALSARSNHTAVYRGTEMIVWGGITLGGVYNTGGRYDVFSYMFMPIISLNGSWHPGY